MADISPEPTGHQGSSLFLHTCCAPDSRFWTYDDVVAPILPDPYLETHWKSTPIAVVG